MPYLLTRRHFFICNKYNVKILSILSRVTLVQQPYETFLKYNIETKKYTDTLDEKKDNILIQLDSIIKLNLEDYSNHIVYLNECNSLTDYLINSVTLDKKQLLVYKKLMQIIKQRKRLIITDADISNLVFKLIEIKEILIYQYLFYFQLI